MTQRPEPNRQVKGLQADLVRSLRQQVLTGEWVRGRLMFNPLIPDEDLRVVLTAADDSWQAVPAPSDAIALWRKLRRVQFLQDTDRGAWITCQLKVERDGSWGMTYDYETRVWQYDGFPWFTAPETGPITPSDQDWADDLRLFPRTQENLPEWLADIGSRFGIPVAIAPSAEMRARNRLVGTLLDEMDGSTWTTATDYVVIEPHGAWGTMRDDRPRDAKEMWRTVNLFDVWKDLREAMTDPERGAWLFASLTVTPDGPPKFFFEYERRPSIYAPDDNWFPEVPDRKSLSPSDGAWLTDLKQHPRSPENTPAWMKKIVDKDARKQNPANMPRTKAAIKADVTWPQGLAALAMDEGWAGIFGAISDSIGRRLKTGDYAILADEEQEDFWSAEADGLAQDVFADVSTTFIEGKPLAALASYWRVWSDTIGKKPDPAGLSGVDLSDLAVYEEARPPVQHLFDDVGDTVTSLIDAQIFQRFGVLPEA